MSFNLVANQRLCQASSWIWLISNVVSTLPHPQLFFDRHLVLTLTCKWPEQGIMNLATHLDGGLLHFFVSRFEIISKLCQMVDQW